MLDGQQGVITEHSRTGIAHYGFDFRAHLRRITVDLAKTAKGLGCHHRTLIDSLGGVFEQFLTLMAKFGFRVMVLMAIDDDHHFDNVLFVILFF